MITELLIFLMCVIVHEIGHYIPARIFKADPHYYVKRGTLIMRSVPTNRHAGIIITMSGIIAGIIPLFIFREYIAFSAFIIILAAMVVGSHIDFRNIYKTYFDNYTNVNLNGFEMDAIVQLALVIFVVGIVSLIGISILENMSDKTALESISASGTLTFTDDVTDGELVNISVYTFEFDTDGSTVPGYIQVPVTQDNDGTINQTIAILNLTSAIQANSDTNALVSAVAS